MELLILLFILFLKYGCIILTVSSVIFINYVIDTHFSFNQSEKWGFFETILALMWGWLGFIYILIQYSKYLFFKKGK